MSLLQVLAYKSRTPLDREYLETIWTHFDVTERLDYAHAGEKCEIYVARRRDPQKQTTIPKSPAVDIRESWAAV